MNIRNRSNGMVIATLAISLFILATFISARSLINGWVSFIFIPLYAISFVITYFIGTKLFDRNTPSKYDFKLFISACLYLLTSILVVGDNGDSGAYFWQRNGYESAEDLPRLIRIFEEISVPMFVAAGVTFLVYMIKSSKSETF